MDGRETATCEFMDDCSFWRGKLDDLPHMADALREYFCQKDFKDCARHVVHKALGVDAVPGDLLPTDRISAEKIIDGGVIKPQQSD